ncbi:MAG: hypothetical protein HZB25_12935 [Candidatus Eisenbacteria bacterium]|nr:hypothetical protein [Candidatus Eisenbacteria bacterium]
MSHHKAAGLPLTLPKDTPRGLSAILLLMVAAGAAMFAFELTRDPARAWRAYFVAVMFFYGISIAGVVWSAVTRLSNGRFAAPVVRIMEGLGAFQPAGYLLFLAFLFLGARHVYPWIHEEYKPAPHWLNLESVQLRQGLVMLAVTLFNLAFMRLALRPDMAVLQSKVPGKLRGLYRGWARGFGGSDVEVERNRLTLMRLSPMVVIFYAISMTLLSVDLVMSMEPEWVSTLFPGIGFIGTFLGAICVTAVITSVVRFKWKLEETITPRTMHSVGLLVFAFCTFWMSMHWAEYLTIWYAKLPEETGWMQARLGAESPWLPVSIASVVCVWLVPFVSMMTKAAKSNPKSLSFFACLMLTGLWLERLVFIAPAPEASPEHVTLGFVEVLVAGGVLGLFSLCYLWFVSVFPPLPAVDPYGPGSDTH